MSQVPRWRLAAGGIVLAVLAFFAILFTPVYVRNMKLQSYVDGLTHRVENNKQSDEELRAAVLDKARELNLPVTEGDVHILRSSDRVRIDVQYAVTVNSPLYTVALHFYPGAGSR